MFIVSRTNIEQILKKIAPEGYLGLDTETTGLHPFHGDRMFSLILATKDEEYYFNWNEYPDLPKDLLLDENHYQLIQNYIFSDTDRYYFIHKAIFDHPMLEQDGMYLHGTVHCTITGARVQYNEHYDYSLEACGERIKVKKNAVVEDYIKKHRLYTMADMNGFKIKKKRYDLVPFDIMTKYGCQDGRVVYDLGMHQLDQIEKRAQKQANNRQTIQDCHHNELRLQRTLHGIQMRGAKVDLPYCRNAVDYFNEEMSKSKEEFRGLTDTDMVLSAKCLGPIFENEKEKWDFTEKGNPSFTEPCLNRLENPAAKEVLRYKKAKAKIDFFNNFIKFADSEGFIHTEFKSYGTRTGRFSSASPNLQNLEKAKGEDLNQPFVVRRAFIPRDGFFFAMIDYDQIEYRMMLDYARANDLIDKVLGGLDVHTATAEVAGVTRDDAKTVNFLTLYGGGIAKLAAGLGTTEKRAKEIQASIFDAAPEIRSFIRQVIRTAENRGHIFNWLGRVSYFPKRNLCYKAPNTLIQGGAGDVNKVAMNECDEMLAGRESNIMLNIHDEICFEMHYDEAHLLQEIKHIMETVYPHQRLPLTCGIEWSAKSLADKKEFTGLECLHGEKGRNQVQGKDIPTAKELTQNMGQEDTASGAQGHP